MGRARKPAALKPLTPEQQRFVDEYLIDLNGTRAYRIVYPGTSYASARALASQLLAKVNIRSEVKAARIEQQKRTRVTADRVIRELARCAFSDVYDLYDSEGKLRAARDIPLETRKAVAAVKIRKEKITRRQSGETDIAESECEVEYKMWNKLDALGKLCNHLGLTTEITPFEALLASLPPHLAGEVRALLAQSLPGGDGAEGNAKRASR
jgi:phage terminase small subunit